jgi:hypothetical protein
MTKTDLREMVLILIAERFEEALAEPEPARWRSWDVERWEANREYGPPYSTIRWFGALAATEAGRMRCLRMVYALESEGLLETFKDAFSGSKLDRVRLTEAGWTAVASLRTREMAGIAKGS